MIGPGDELTENEEIELCEIIQENHEYLEEIDINDFDFESYI